MPVITKTVEMRHVEIGDIRGGWKVQRIRDGRKWVTLYDATDMEIDKQPHDQPVLIERWVPENPCAVCGRQEGRYQHYGHWFCTSHVGMSNAYREKVTRCVSCGEPPDGDHELVDFGYGPVCLGCADAEEILVADRVGHGENEDTSSGGI